MGEIGQQAIIIGNSFNNTLGLIRSLGEAGIDIILFLVGASDRLCIVKSRYLRNKKIFQVEKVEDCLPILKQIANGLNTNVIICTNDMAAQFIDLNEHELSQYYSTPMQGGQLGNLMNKDVQCHLAEECGFTVPKSLVYRRGNEFPKNLNYPLLLKPINSNEGAKSDIHICKTYDDVEQSLSRSSACQEFIIQEYIEKEYEINLIGVSTSHGVYVPGGIRKIRHYPTIYSPCSFGLFQSVNKINIDTTPIIKFITQVGYRGPFSVELLHKGDKDYFMEVNFRHDGLAYAATASGANLPALLFRENGTSIQVKDIYMMDLSIDFCHVKNGNLSLKDWIKDFRRTGCFLNYNRKDKQPTISYYKNKIKQKLHL